MSSNYNHRRSFPRALRNALLLAVLTALGPAVPAPPARAAQPAPAEKPPATAAPTVPLEELFGDDVIAKANGVEIRQSQLDKAFLAFQANLAARGQRIPNGEQPLREAILLDRMIVTFLITNRATRMDLSIAAANAERFYTDTKKAAGTDEAFLRQLKLSGLTPEEFNHRILEQAVAEAVVDRELESKQTVTEEEISAFYNDGVDLRARLLQEEIAKLQKDPQAKPELVQGLQERLENIRTNNLARITSPETVKVMHIHISSRAKTSDTQLPEQQRLQKRRQAEDVLRRARAGEDFATLIKSFSEDRNLERTDGIYTLSRKDPFPPEFVAASFSLEPGQISDVVTSSSGFHIIKLLERAPAAKRPLTELKEEIQSFLKQQKVQKAMPDFFTEVKKEGSVEILSKKYGDLLKRIEGRNDLDPAVP